MSKMDYSRLLDDEFLNKGDRVRVRIASRGATRILGSRSFSIALHAILAAAMLAAVLTIIVFLGQQKTLQHFLESEHDGAHREVTHELLQHLDNRTNALHRVQDHDQIIELHVHDHDHDHKTADITDHHVALSGGFFTEHQEDDHVGHNDDSGIHHHNHEGDIVIEDHHIIAAEPSKHLHNQGMKKQSKTRHTLLLCVPVPTGVNSDQPISSRPESVPGNATNWLTKAEEKNVQIAMDLFNGTHMCHVVVVEEDNVPKVLNISNVPKVSSVSNVPKVSRMSTAPAPTSHPESSSPPTEPPSILGSTSPVPLKSQAVTATPSDVTPPTPRRPRRDLTQTRPIPPSPTVNATNTSAPLKFPASSVSPRIGNFSRCNYYYLDDDQTTRGAASTAVHEDLILSSGQRVAAVRWNGSQFFSETPFRSNWQKLETITQFGERQGNTLLDVVARLVLVWRYGGVSIDLHAPVEHVLMALAVVNKTATARTFLETKRATVISAPQTCNAVIFEVLKTVTRAIAEPRNATMTPHQDDVEGDINVFDDVLNVYCKHGRRKVRSLPKRLKTSPLKILKAEPEFQSTYHERLEKTICRGNLIALTLA